MRDRFGKPGNLARWFLLYGLEPTRTNARPAIPMKKAQCSVWFWRLAAVLVAGLSFVRAQVEGPNGHYYKVVLEPNLLWAEAKAHAQDSTYNGVHGYLATITSQEEDVFIENLRMQAAPGGYGSLWVGGSQVGTGTFPVTRCGAGNDSG